MSTQEHSRKKRGFVLIVALMLAVATAAVAVGLIQTSGSANVAVTHTNAGEAARALAETGMARATSYALTISRPRVDFDKVLDPGATFGAAGQANCSNLDSVADNGVVPETGNMYLPMFTDPGSTIIPNYEGLRWRMVPYNGGAYLVRFSDNYDDGPAAPAGGAIDWSTSTSNTLSGSPGDSAWCAEGPTIPTAVPTPGINGVNNPARDRDRTIYATVIGIYPGTNPATATHRSVLSKVVMDGRVLGPAGMRIGGNMQIDNGAEVELCSQVSGINTTGNISSGPPGSCACGSVTASSVDIDDGSCGACCGPSNPYEAVTGTAPPAPIIPAVDASNWYDWTSSCNFYLTPTNISLYYWDAAGTRTVGNCNTYNGALPAPVQDVTQWGSCWVPLWHDTDAGGSVDMSDPLGIENGVANDEVATAGDCDGAGPASCVMRWRPKNSVVGPINLGTGGSGYYSTATVDVTKPDWSIACPADLAISDFTWNPPQVGNAGEAVHCGSSTNANASRASGCDGSRIVWEVSESAAASERWQLKPNPHAVPPGVYYMAGPWNVTEDHVVPGAQSPLLTNAWPMMTMIVNGDVSMNNAKEIVIGVGTRRQFFPSLVVNGDLSTSNGAQLALAGSLYVIGDVTFQHGNAGGTYLYGRVEVTGNFNQQSGSRVDWRYDTDLFAAGVTRRAAEPRIAYPLGF